MAPRRLHLRVGIDVLQEPVLVRVRRARGAAQALEHAAGEREAADARTGEVEDVQVLHGQAATLTARDVREPRARARLPPAPRVDDHEAGREDMGLLVLGEMVVQALRLAPGLQGDAAPVLVVGASLAQGVRQVAHEQHVDVRPDERVVFRQGVGKEEAVEGRQGDVPARQVGERRRVHVHEADAGKPRAELRPVPLAEVADEDDHVVARPGMPRVEKRRDGDPQRQGVAVVGGEDDRHAAAVVEGGGDLSPEVPEGPGGGAEAPPGERGRDDGTPTRHRLQDLDVRPPALVDGADDGAARLVLRIDVRDEAQEAHAGDLRPPARQAGRQALADDSVFKPRQPLPPRRPLLAQEAREAAHVRPVPEMRDREEHISARRVEAVARLRRQGDVRKRQRARMPHPAKVVRIGQPGDLRPREDAPRPEPEDPPRPARADVFRQVVHVDVERPEPPRRVVGRIPQVADDDGIVAPEFDLRQGKQEARQHGVQRAADKCLEPTFLQRRSPNHRHLAKCLQRLMEMMAALRRPARQVGRLVRRDVEDPHGRPPRRAPRRAASARGTSARTCRTRCIANLRSMTARRRTPLPANAGRTARHMRDVAAQAAATRRPEWLLAAEPATWAS